METALHSGLLKTPNFLRLLIKIAALRVSIANETLRVGNQTTFWIRMALGPARADDPGYKQSGFA
jgi:hypothetical protein